jgi:hypothetical protein
MNLSREKCTDGESDLRDESEMRWITYAEGFVVNLLSSTDLGKFQDVERSLQEVSW